MCPEESARDLASAYDNWLDKSSIPEAALTQVSAKALERIGKIEPSLRLKIEKHLRQEIKYTESNLSCFLKTPRSKQKTIHELIEKANSAGDKIHDKEKNEKFKNLFIENIQFKQKNLEY